MSTDKFTQSDLSLEKPSSFQLLLRHSEGDQRIRDISEGLITSHVGPTYKKSCRSWRQRQTFITKKLR